MSEETYLEQHEFLLTSPFRFTQRVSNLKKKLSMKEKDLLESKIKDLNDGEFESIEKDPLFESIEEYKGRINHIDDLEPAIETLYLGDAILLLEHREKLRRERRRQEARDRQRLRNQSRRRGTRRRPRNSESRSISRGGKSKKQKKIRRHRKTKKN